jgi:hypothetical protein
MIPALEYGHTTVTSSKDCRAFFRQLLLGVPRYVLGADAPRRLFPDADVTGFGRGDLDSAARPSARADRHGRKEYVLSGGELKSLN